MKALVKKESRRGLWLEDVPEPKVGVNDVLIRVDRTGICGTDLRIYKWDEWAQATIPVPMVVVHEFVREVVETGSNVTDFHPGEMVSAEGHVVCGRCRNCLAGRRHLCDDSKGIGVNRPGAFAEFISAPMNVWHQWEGIDPDVASISDPFGNAVHTTLSFDALGEDVLITGASLKVFEILEALTELRDRLEANTAFFREGVRQLGLDIRSGRHPIVPVMLGEAFRASRMADALLDRRVYVIGFSHPVVPYGRARSRTQISAAHSRADLEFALEPFAAIRDQTT